MPKLSIQEAIEVWGGRVPVMNKHQAACYLNISPRTLQRIELERGVHIRTELLEGKRCTRYRIEALQEFLKERSEATRKAEKKLAKQAEARRGY
jgi:hypothetical protein